jgi:hypothetical protein
VPREVDPQLVALFGSATRVSVLAALAGASAPWTGYRVAKVAGLQEIKAYRELERLRAAGIVRTSGNGWVLPPGELRTFLARRLRVSWSEDWFAGENGRALRARRVLDRPTRWFDARRYRPDRAVAACYAKEFERPPEKDELALRSGLRRSRKRR